MLNPNMFINVSMIDRAYQMHLCAGPGNVFVEEPFNGRKLDKFV